MRAAILALVALATPAAAQPMSDRVVTIISPYALSANATVRVLADAIGRDLGQTVVTVARDGGSGTVGMRALSGSAADGHMLAYTPITPVVVQPHMVRNLGYTPASFAPVCNVTENVLGIVVRADSPFRDVRDIAAEAKRRPLTFGSAGPNSIPYLGVHRIQLAMGGDYTHVPFRGDQPPITEVLGGRLDFASIVVSSGAEMVKRGDLRLLGVFSNRRHPEFPDVPTVQQQGIDALQLSYAGLFAPAGTPPAVLDRLETACRRALQDPVFVRVATAGGIVTQFMGRAEQAQLLAREYENFGRVLRDLGVQPE